MRATTLGLTAAIAAGLTTPALAEAASPYTTAPFRAETTKATFGQAPTFMPDGRVVFGREAPGADPIQVYMANQDGSGERCLTCGQPGPNGVPTPRPQGDWILFHSWRNHKITLGSPGFGGLGSALYVMRPDGTGVTPLTGFDPARGGGEGEDAYHAYWSPDGKRVAWAHLNWNFITNGGQGRWDIRVADFVDDGNGPPRLDNVRVVRPPNGHYYETQWWAPDGSGFLYTETFGTTMNTELFFCRLTADGCDVRRLTNDSAWDEQAIFTPDGKSVIFMSTRDHPGFYNSFTETTQAAGMTTEMDWLLTLPIFEVSFLQPVAQEATDLYQLDLETGSVRRLTTDGEDGWITPEFTWDPKNEFLLWTELRYPDGARVPLPVELAEQARKTAAFLTNPPDGIGQRHGNELALLPLEARTRVARFGLPPATTCANRPALRLSPPRAKGRRVVRVDVLVAGKRVLTRRGKDVGRVKLPRPAARRFTLRIVATQSDGRKLTATRTYRDCPA